VQQNSTQCFFNIEKEMSDQFYFSVGGRPQILAEDKGVHIGN